MAVSALFMTTASKETLSGTIVGVTSLGGRNKSYTPNRTHQIVPFSKNTLTMKSHYTKNLEHPMCVYIYIYIYIISYTHVTVISSLSLLLLLSLSLVGVYKQFCKVRGRTSRDSGKLHICIIYIYIVMCM